MSFGIIRVRKLTSARDIRNSDIHNFRLYDEMGISSPKNLIGEKYAKNSFILSDPTKSMSTPIIEEEIKKRGLKTRKNSVVALEYVVALSPDCKKIYECENYDPHGLLYKLSQFVCEKHGVHNVISISQHFDETNPHAHIVVIPAVEKTLKWKNKNGQGEKTIQTLCADDYVGTKDKLRKLQSDFFKHVKGMEANLNSYLPMGEGVLFRRGMDARNQPKKYTYKTNASLGELREHLRQAEKEERKRRMSKGRETFKRMDPFNPPKEPPIRKLKPNKGKDFGITDM